MPHETTSLYAVLTSSAPLFPALPPTRSTLERHGWRAGLGRYLRKAGAEGGRELRVRVGARPSPVSMITWGGRLPYTWRRPHANRTAHLEPASASALWPEALVVIGSGPGSGSGSLLSRAKIGTRLVNGSGSGSGSLLSRAKIGTRLVHCPGSGSGSLLVVRPCENQSQPGWAFVRIFFGLGGRAGSEP